MNDSKSQLVLKYLLQHKPYTLLRQHTQTNKNVSALVTQSSILWLMVHVRLAQSFYKTQLVDIFSYETPNFSVQSPKPSSSTGCNNATVVYNFHNLLNQTRYFIFTTSTLKQTTRHHKFHTLAVDSITELFSTA